MSNTETGVENHY